jgi:predicted metalloprotease with PDZ domain
MAPNPVIRTEDATREAARLRRHPRGLSHLEGTRMNRTPSYYLAVAVGLVLVFGATLAFAGGAKCAAQHTQADYQKMAEKMAGKGWIGIETEKSAAGGYAVKAVVAGSPADRAGFLAGDELIALNGVKLGEENQEALAKVKSSLGPGKEVTYTIRRGGAEKSVTARMTSPPREVLASWVGEHVLEHTSLQVAAN